MTNRSFLVRFSMALAMAGCTAAQTYTISTFAGGRLPAGIPGPSAELANARSVAVDGAGHVYFATGHVVMRLDAGTGMLSLVAGNGTVGSGGDGGPADCAQLRSPNGVAVNRDGEVFIADTANHRIRKVSGGIITTVAGNGNGGFSGDGGPPVNARLSAPSGVALDIDGNLYIADSGNARIRKVSGGIITTLAGNGTSGPGAEGGPATDALLGSPWGIAVDGAGSVYVALWDNSGNSRVRKVADGVITTVAGTGPNGFSADGGPAVSAQLSQPQSVAVDALGDLYIADSGRVRKVSNGVITTVAGSGRGGVSSATFGGDNVAATETHVSPSGVAVDEAGNLYIADSYYNRVRKVFDGRIATVAGGGTALGEGDTATNAQVRAAGIALNAAGQLYVADENHSVRRIADGVITTIAGNGPAGVFGNFAGDGGSAASAQFLGPQRVAVDGLDDIYIADYARIRKISGGMITTVAGGGQQGSSGDGGPAVNARIFGASALAVDALGSLYISDWGSNRVRKITSGVITTVAGGGTALGDGGAATEAQLSPRGLAVDAAGDLYIADISNHRIRKVSGGVITTVAGGGSSFADEVSATDARLVSPTGVAVDAAGNLYIAEFGRGLIRKVSNGVITRIAGGGSSFGDGGAATDARLERLSDIVVDAVGNVYLTDEMNSRIRVLRPQVP